MYKIQTLNNIALAGLRRLPRERYEVASEVSVPDAVLLRSFKMHDWPLPDTVKAIGRAGAGVNNIPVDEMTRRGIPVFNAPGANANAVKELVLLGLLMASRNIGPALNFVQALEGTDEEISKQVESGKKQFVGTELPSRTLGVIGLGAIGVKVANAALGLGMRVLGFDPNITINNALQLSSSVEQAPSLDALLSEADFVTLHVPLIDATRHMINVHRLKQCRSGATILNFSRQGVVDEEAICQALQEDRLHSYVCDFPGNVLKAFPGKVIALPHLGASTREAEENCAIMVADQVRDFLEHGAVRNSVNFPTMDMPQADGRRLLVVNVNVPNMIEQITGVIGSSDINIIDMLNRSRGEIACTLLDLEGDLPESLVDDIRAINGVMMARYCGLCG